MKVVIATHNEDKLKEILTHLESFSFNVLSLKKFPKIGEIIEDGHTLTDNALIKAREVFDKTGLPTISDDTGLEVDALNGEPGVYSARWAGENCTYADNVNKLLYDMQNIKQQFRTAVFKTVVTYVSHDLELVAEGSVQGTITKKPFGKQGFGYDPIFYVLSHQKTFAEMSVDEKNKCSHRAQAIANLKGLFKKYKLLSNN